MKLEPHGQRDGFSRFVFFLGKPTAMPQAILIGLFLAFQGSGRAVVDQSDELRQKATVLKSEAVRLAEAGQKADASRLATIADDLMSMADRSSPQPRRGTISGPARVLLSLNSLLQERQKLLHEYERRMRNPNGDHAVRKLREDINDLRREISRVEHDNRNAGRIEEMASQILHLRVAADHLQQAGMLDLAGQALMKAGVLDQEILDLQKKATGKESPPSPPTPTPAEAPKSTEADELRKENEKLKAEVEELRKQAKAK